MGERRSKSRRSPRAMRVPDALMDGIPLKTTGIDPSRSDDTCAIRTNVALVSILQQCKNDLSNYVSGFGVKPRIERVTVAM